MSCLTPVCARTFKHADFVKYVTLILSFDARLCSIMAICIWRAQRLYVKIPALLVCVLIHHLLWFEVHNLPQGTLIYGSYFSNAIIPS